MRDHWKAATKGEEQFSFLQNGVTAVLVLFVIWILLLGFREWSTGELRAGDFGFVVLRSAALCLLIGVIFTVIKTV